MAPFYRYPGTDATARVQGRLTRIAYRHAYKAMRRSGMDRTLAHYIVGDLLYTTVCGLVHYEGVSLSAWTTSTNFRYNDN